MITIENIREALQEFDIADEYNQYNHVLAAYETSLGEGKPDRYEVNYDFIHTAIEVVRVNDTDWVCYLTTTYHHMHDLSESIVSTLTIELGSDAENMKDSLAGYVYLQHNRGIPKNDTPLNFTML